MRANDAAANESPQVHPIRRARQREGLSLAQCAVKAGIAVSTLQIAERGLVSERVAKRIARALHTTPAELLGAAPTPTENA